MRGDDPRVVPELVREQRFADSADEEMKPDEERQTDVHGCVYEIGTSLVNYYRPLRCRGRNVVGGWLLLVFSLTP